jgi:hypothetical protein
MRTDTALVGLLMGALVACSDGPPDEMEAAPGETGEEIALAIDDFQAEVREVTNELSVTVDGLDTRYASASDETATQWTSAKAEIAEARYELEEDLAALRRAAGAESEGLRAEIVGDLETLTERVERARLSALESSRDLLAESEDREIRELHEASEGLPSEAREEADRAIVALEREAQEVRAAVERLGTVAAEGFEEERDAVARDVAQLTAAVRRELVELRHEIVS